MKWWIVVVLCWGIMMFMIMNASYASPTPLITNDRFLTIPVVRTEDDKLYEAHLQCSVDVQHCIVVYVKEICEPGLTRFSPSFCWEFGR